jgi:hypothetical protein
MARVVQSEIHAADPDRAVSTTACWAPTAK